MHHIIKEAPDVAEAFFSLTKNITEYSTADKKLKELILIGIFTAIGGIRGIGTHVERAVKQGATKNEILSAILFAMPVVGISNVNLAMEKALETLEGKLYKNEIDRS